MMRALLLAVSIALVSCGGPDAEGSRDFSSCEETRADCAGDACILVDDCYIERCEWEVEYEFDGEEYESTCTRGRVVTTTTYPLSGGGGERRIDEDLKDCFYEIDVEYYDDVDERATCTVRRDCTVESLRCESSEPGDPDCDVVGSAPCPAEAA